jgi:hypothetical protein
MSGEMLPNCGGLSPWFGERSEDRTKVVEVRGIEYDPSIYLSNGK